MSNVNLNQLLVAVVLYEKRSVTRAAKALGTSQPSISNALSSLRKAFNDVLFIKTARGMEPTPRAKLLVESARGVLMHLNQNVVDEKSFDASTATDTFTFALSEVGELLVFPKICKAVRALAPHAHVRSLSPMQDDLLHGMASGKIDVAVGNFAELRRNSFFRHPLRQSEVVCLMRADHPVRGDSLSLNEYRKLRHLEVGAEGRIGQHWKRLFRGTNAKRTIVAGTTFVIGIPEVIQSYDAVATITRPQADYFCKANKNLKTVRAPFLKVRGIVSLYWHRNLQDQPKNQWIRNLIEKLYAEDEDLRDSAAILRASGRGKLKDGSVHLG